MRLWRLSMDKKLSIAIIIAIIAVLAIAAFFVLNNSFIPESSQQTVLSTST